MLSEKTDILKDLERVEELHANKNYSSMKRVRAYIERTEKAKKILVEHEEMNHDTELEIDNCVDRVLEILEGKFRKVSIQARWA